MLSNLKDKIILITGASSGFGKDTAQIFAAEDARVVLLARRMDRLQFLADEINGSGGQAFPIGMDVTDPQSIDQAIKKVFEMFGRIDILFNNAGFGRLDWFENLDLEKDVIPQVNVNLLGLMMVTHAVLPIMIAQQSGHIINMSSVAGLIPAPMYSIYAATKFGVRGFTEALRREVSRKGIFVSGIYPGPAQTEFGHHVGKGFKSIKFKAPGWSFMTSEYVARCVVNLAMHPRRSMVIPWWFKPIRWVEACFPSVLDASMDQFFTKKYR